MKNILARGGIEFIAVVMGITISLWIEDGKNKNFQLKEQISLLENLKTSLNQDLEYALKIEKSLDTCLVSQKYLINLDCSNIDTLKNSVFVKHIEYSTKGGWSFFPRYGVYRALSQNNDLGLIDSDVLKSRLITLYDFIYKRYENIDIVMVLLDIFAISAANSLISASFILIVADSTKEIKLSMSNKGINLTIIALVL